jgi:membrane protein
MVRISTSLRQAGRMRRLAGARVATVAALQRRLPMLSLALRFAGEADVVDRAAALTLFCIFAAVPSLFVAFSVVGFLLGAVDDVTTLTGAQLELQSSTLARIGAWLRTALPGVTWNPADFAAALVRHRGTHGIVGTVLAISLSLTVFSRVDNAVRAVFGQAPRSTLRAAGYISLLVLIVAFVAMVLTIAAPLTEWGLRIAGRGIARLSFGSLDGIAIFVTASQVLPVALVFFAQVSWSVRSVSRRRLAITSLAFGILWFLGQRLFTLYVTNVVQMDAVYGALTGIIALMLWLFYANIAFMFAVSMLAAWEHRYGKRGPEHALQPVAHPGP